MIENYLFLSSNASIYFSNIAKDKNICLFTKIKKINVCCTLIN